MRTRTWLVVGVAVALLPAATLRADVRGEYRYADGGPALIVEVAENGNARIGTSDTRYFLVIDGQGYWVVTGAEGPTATTAEAQAELGARRLRRMAALDELANAEAPPEMSEAERQALEEELRREVDTAMDETLQLLEGAQGGEETVREAAADFDPASTSAPAPLAEREGRVFPLPEAPQIDLIVTDDEALAALGAPLFSYYDAMYGQFSSEPAPFARHRDALRGKAPLSINGLRLHSASFASLSPSRFVLPQKVIALADLAPESASVLLTIMGRER